ncbi:MAG: DUF4926 domain-containing protein [Cyanobium sp.]
MLPHADHALVEEAKICDYLLSATHPVGRYKARVFRSLGYTAESWTRLRDDLLQHGQPGLVSAFPEVVMFVLHQTVALTHDIPDADLQLGDLGAVVAIYDPENIEVEFVAASGRTQSLLTLSRSSLRAIGDQDLIAVSTLA